MHVAAIVGGQWGSEGKGVISAELAFDFDAIIRTGGPNAGHSFIWQGKKWVMQSIPCGWINPRAYLVLGPGAVINPSILVNEVAMIEGTGISVMDRLLVDHRATILDGGHMAEEGHTSGEIWQRIGSTGEGVGAARHAKMSRDKARCYLAGTFDWNAYGLPNLQVIDTTRWLFQMPNRVLLEGTQGYGLSLHLGDWPYTTSAQCTSAQLCADAGLPPKVDRCYMVVRTYPIRVAGNSGPMGKELSWEEISRRAGQSVIERTTVTKKIRRVAEFDFDQVAIAAKVNGATDLVINFVDYLGLANCGVTKFEDLEPEARVFCLQVAQRANVHLSHVGTGFFADERGWTHCRLAGSDYEEHVL